MPRARLGAVSIVVILTAAASRAFAQFQADVPVMTPGALALPLAAAAAPAASPVASPGSMAQPTLTAAQSIVVPHPGLIRRASTMLPGLRASALASSDGAAKDGGMQAAGALFGEGGGSGNGGGGSKGADPAYPAVTEKTVNGLRRIASAFLGTENGGIQWAPLPPMGAQWVSVPLFTPRDTGAGYNALILVAPLTAPVPAGDPNLASQFILERTEGGRPTGYSKAIDMSSIWTARPEINAQTRQRLREFFAAQQKKNFEAYAWQSTTDDDEFVEIPMTLPTSPTAFRYSARILVGPPGSPTWDPNNAYLVVFVRSGGMIPEKSYTDAGPFR